MKSRKNDMRQLDDGTLVIHFIRNLTLRFGYSTAPTSEAENVTNDNFYSPTSTAHESALDAFCSQLEDQICNEKSLYKIIAGNFSVKLATANKNELWTGKFESKDRNESGNRLHGFFSALINPLNEKM
uniref:Uncharacterized protein n=1 Tax=Angiostrongylus cantonensis TaxID=6313 RepID=A0A0K0DQC3_ANGCA